MTASELSGADHFGGSLGCLVDPILGEMASQASALSGLESCEKEAIVEACRQSLTGILHRKLARVLLLELHAARLRGRLSREDSRQRWQEFLELAGTQAFWDELSAHYPTMPGRVERLVRNRCAATLQFARSWCHDRASLRVRNDTGTEAAGSLREVHFDAGDSHCAGGSVAVVRTDAGALVYKPRSLAIDAALARFVDAIGAELPDGTPMRVPDVQMGVGYGWTEFIPHRYASEGELQAFYRGIGHWLAVMRLLGGTDLHAENLIAHGRHPVVVDCETLFTPFIPAAASGCGGATDQAAALLNRSVLNVGLLPGRASALIWRGVDASAVGNLPGQQPRLAQPGIVDAGTDQARLGTIWAEAPVAQNHPSRSPALTEYWPEVMAGFDEVTTLLHRLDAAGRLADHLDGFASCAVRVVTRSTESYSEIARMLWHPVSLHAEAAARQRATDLLARMAEHQRLAPSDPKVIAAEIDELLVGDIPYFATTVNHGGLTGPGMTQWLAPQDLRQSALASWRGADLALERNVIRVSLVTAYLSDGGNPVDARRECTEPRCNQLDARRREVLTRVMQAMVAGSMSAQDGTATWIAPVLTPTGWSVQPLGTDLYSGLAGVGVVLQAYQREVRAGRAGPIAGLEALASGVLRSLDCAEDVLEQDRLKNPRGRPPEPGAYIGLGSQIWARLMLSTWEPSGRHLGRACQLANGMSRAVAADSLLDLLAGRTGAIVPLLALHRSTGHVQYIDVARQIGDDLCACAIPKGDTLFWRESRWPEGIGGFAHGVTGIGWALTWLARATGEPRYQQVADRAFAFEDALFDEAEQGWLDLRNLGGARTAAAWCHGAVGIGLARLDLDPDLQEPATRRTLQQAAAAAWSSGFGWTHSPCHGDSGAWELMTHAARLNAAPTGVDAERVLGMLLTSIEDHGLVTGLTKQASPPGLMAGLGGIAYQLLRAHPDCDLPSILLPGGGGSTWIAQQIPSN